MVSRLVDDERQLFDVLANRASEQEQRVVRELLDWARKSALSVEFRVSSKISSFNAYLVQGDIRSRLFTVSTNYVRAGVEVPFEHMKAVPFDRADKRLELARRLNSIDGVRVDISDSQNLAEQIDQQATYEVAATALGVLLARYPGRSWDLAPGAHGAGHDIQSTDGQIVAEVFAAVHPRNNGKRKKDIAKLEQSAAPNRYLFFRSPQTPASEWVENGVTDVALPEYRSS